MFYLLSFLVDSAQAMVMKTITTKKRPSQSAKESRRNSNMSKERVPSNNSTRPDRINRKTHFFKIHPRVWEVRPQAIYGKGRTFSKILVSRDSWLRDNNFVPSRN